MLNEVDTRLTIAYDVLLTCAVLAHDDGVLTKEQRDLLNRIVDDLDSLRNETRS